MSLMNASEITKLLATQPAATALALRSAISEVVRNGWNRRDIVEAALDVRLDSMRGGGSLDVEGLVGLAGCIDSEVFSRVLAATDFSDPDFLISMLDDQYAEGVRRSMQAAPTMTDSLRAATLASATRLLESQRQRA